VHLILEPVLSFIYPAIAAILLTLDQFHNLLLYLGAQALQHANLQTQG